MVCRFVIRVLVNAVFDILWILVEVYLNATEWVIGYKSLVTGMGGVVGSYVLERWLWVKLIDICLKIILMIIDSKLIIV